MKRLLLLFYLIVTPIALRAFPADSISLDTRNGRWYILYKIEHGDKIETIAQKYRSTTDEIRSSNYLDQTGLVVGQIIRIPFLFKDLSIREAQQITSNIAGNAVAIPTTTKERRLHKVVRGDTYYNIAKKYSMQLKDLLKINKRTEETKLLEGDEIVVEVSSSTIKPNPTNPPSTSEPAWIHKPAVSPDAIYKRHEITHKIKKGETLNMISQQYKISVDSLRKWNKLDNTNNIAEGKNLIVNIEFKDKDGVVKVRFGGERIVASDSYQQTKADKSQQEIAEVNGVPVKSNKTTQPNTGTNINKPVTTLEEITGKAEVLPQTSNATNLKKMYIYFSQNKRNCSAIITNMANSKKVQAKISADINQQARQKGIIAQISFDVAKELDVAESQMIEGSIQVKVSCTCQSD